MTVTNVPNTIELPESADPNPDINKNLPELLRPQFMVSRVPEMPFILRKRPVTDPVLGRLAITRQGLMPV